MAMFYNSKCQCSQLKHIALLFHKKIKVTLALVHSSFHYLLSQEAFAVGLLLQPLPQRVSVGSVHVDLTEHVKTDVVGLSEPLDLGFIARFLQGKGKTRVRSNRREFKTIN